MQVSSAGVLRIRPGLMSWRILTSGSRSRRWLGLTAPRCAWSSTSARAGLLAAPSASTLELAAGVLAGHRVSLARAITLVESDNPEQRAQAEAMLDHVLRARRAQSSKPTDGPRLSGASAPLVASGSGSFRLGVAGPPGAGKSTFIEARRPPIAQRVCHNGAFVIPHLNQNKPPHPKPPHHHHHHHQQQQQHPTPPHRHHHQALGVHLLSLNLRLAVLAVDPTSTRTGGSILGDKTRMGKLACDMRAYVRPSPTRGTLGGLTTATNDAVLLCEAAGFDTVLVETVGVGQSEVAVDLAVDMVLLLLPPAGGDALQGVKKGIMEIADLVVVNKADGELLPAARHTATEVMHALQLQRPRAAHWTPSVMRCSALSGHGIPEVWARIGAFRTAAEAAGALRLKRASQGSEWMWGQLRSALFDAAARRPAVLAEAASLQAALAAGHTTPRLAARRLLAAFESSCERG